MTAADWLRRAGGWALLTFLGLAAIHVALLPLDLGAGPSWRPDLLFPLLLAASLRRPDLVPLPLLAGLVLLGDVMLDRPIGLMALAAILAIEAIRARRRRLAELPFWVEWAVAALAYALVLIGCHLALELAFATPPLAGDSLRLWLATSLAYPPVVLFLQVCLGLRRPVRPRATRLGRIA